MVIESEPCDSTATSRVSDHFQGVMGEQQGVEGAVEGSGQ